MNFTPGEAVRLTGWIGRPFEFLEYDKGDRLALIREHTGRCIWVHASDLKKNNNKGTTTP